MLNNEQREILTIHIASKHPLGSLFRAQFWISTKEKHKNFGLPGDLMTHDSGLVYNFEITTARDANLTQPCRSRASEFKWMNCIVTSLLLLWNRCQNAAARPHVRALIRYRNGYIITPKHPRPCVTRDYKEFLCLSLSNILPKVKTIRRQRNVWLFLITTMSSLFQNSFVWPCTSFWGRNPI